MYGYRLGLIRPNSRCSYAVKMIFLWMSNTQIRETLRMEGASYLNSIDRIRMLSMAKPPQVELRQKSALVGTARFIDDANEPAMKLSDHSFRSFEKVENFAQEKSKLKIDTDETSRVVRE